MGVTIRSFVLSFLLIIAAFLLYRFSTNLSKPQDDNLLDEYPTFTATKFDAHSYDENGLLTYSFKSDDVTYYKQKDLLEFSNPLGVYYDRKNDALEPWQITAKTGSIIINKEVTLNDDVVIVPLFPKSFVNKVTTDNLYFDMVKNLVTAPGPVSITGTNFTNTGSNLQADLNTQQCTLSGDPHAQYIP